MSTWNNFYAPNITIDTASGNIPSGSGNTNSILYANNPSPGEYVIYKNSNTPLNIIPQTQYELTFHYSDYDSEDTVLKITIYGDFDPVLGVAPGVEFNCSLPTLTYGTGTTLFTSTQTSGAGDAAPPGTSDISLANSMVIEYDPGLTGNQSGEWGIDSFELKEVGGGSTTYSTQWITNNTSHIVGSTVNHGPWAPNTGSWSFNGAGLQLGWPSTSDYLEQDLYIGSNVGTLPGDHDLVELRFDLFDMTLGIGGSHGQGRELTVSFYNSNGKGFKTLPHEISKPAGFNGQIVITKYMWSGSTSNPLLENRIRFELGGRSLLWDGTTPGNAPNGTVGNFKIDNVHLRTMSSNTSSWALLGNNNGGIIDSLPAVQGDIAGNSGAPQITLEQGYHRVSANIATVHTEGKLNVSIGSNASLIDNSAPNVTVDAFTHYIWDPGTYSTDIYVPNDGDYQFTIGNIWGANLGVFEIDSVSLKRIIPFGGTVIPWEIDTVGLGNGQVFYNEYRWSKRKLISFRDAVPGVFIKQPLPLNPDITLENAEFHFNPGDKYRTTFKMSQVELNGLYPKLTMMVYNEFDQGFEQVITLEEGNKNYEFINEIGESTISGRSYLTNNISFYIGEWNGAAWIGDNVAFANIDDISIEKIGGGKTISFSEDVKGWSSFKSFIPEFGISVVNQYYTMKYGKLYKHHIPGTDRNTFYNEFEESSVTPILNMQPDIIKNFNTLFYEGSQSKVDLWDNINSDGEYYNIHSNEGWYIEDIHTDKQSGSLNEFIEKEGKWFNYIKGRSNQIDTAAFNFQGLGIVSTITQN